MKPHWKNYWTNAIPCTLEEIAAMCAHVGQKWADVDGKTFRVTEEWLVAHWKERSAKLDPYVIPGGREHYFGIRYGRGPDKYMSPEPDQAKVSAWLAKRGVR